MSEESEMIDRLCPGSNGCFLDVGCGDPIDFSNTWELYSRGWRGVGVDVRPELAASWHEKRPRDAFGVAAVGKRCELATFFTHGQCTSDNPLWAPSRNVNAFPLRVARVKLHDLWLGMRQCDLLCMDVEGGEYDAFVACDFAAFAPRVICAEALSYKTAEPHWPRWEPILLANDYLFVGATSNGYNRFYVRKSA